MNLYVERAFGPAGSRDFPVARTCCGLEKGSCLCEILTACAGREEFVRDACITLEQACLRGTGIGIKQGHAS